MPCACGGSVVGPAVYNFNSHPELTDEQYAGVCIAVAFGSTPTQSSIDDAVKAIQASGRYSLVFGPQGWAAQGMTVNASDPWFYQVPTWAWLIVAPVAVIVAIGLTWKFWGQKFWKKASAGSSSGSDHL